MFGLFRPRLSPADAGSLNAPLMDRIKAVAAHPDRVAQILGDRGEPAPAIERFRVAFDDRFAACNAIVGSPGCPPARHATRADRFANRVSFTGRGPMSRDGGFTYEFALIEVRYN